MIFQTDSPQHQWQWHPMASGRTADDQWNCLWAHHYTTTGSCMEEHVGGQVHWSRCPPQCNLQSEAAIKSCSCRAGVQVPMIKLTQMQHQQGAGLWYLQLPSHFLR